MNKRILSILLCLLLVASLLVLAIPVGAAPSERIELKVVTETTSAKAGDTVAYQVVMGPVSAVGSIQMALDIPAGLTYVAGSGAAASGAKEAMGFDALDFTEASVMLNGYASSADYKSESDTVLATFECTVNAEATGVLTVGLTNIELGSCETFEVYDTDAYVVISDNVTVEGDTPVVDPTEAPVPHSHTLVFVEEVPATEEADGVKAHYVCEGPEGCGKLFADATGNVELTEADLVIPKIVPVVDPTEEPVVDPTDAPVVDPTEAPVVDPTTAPVVDPTTAPVVDPTTAPVVDPTVAPTTAPTEAATVAPTVKPTSKTSTKDTATKDTASSDSKSSTSPKTGDSTNTYLWLLIMLASMVGAGAVLFTAKRKGIFTK